MLQKPETKAWHLSAYSLAAVAIYLSLTPSLYLQEILEHISLGENLAHFVLYLALMCLFTKVYFHRIGLIKIGLALMAFSISIEFLQELSPYRGFELEDILSNSIGVFVGFLLSISWTKLKSQSTPL